MCIKLAIFKIPKGMVVPQPLLCSTPMSEGQCCSSRNAKAGRVGIQPVHRKAVLWYVLNFIMQFY